MTILTITKEGILKWTRMIAAIIFFLAVAGMFCCDSVGAEDVASGESGTCEWKIDNKGKQYMVVDPE